jgi:serine/threonine protein kinase/Flp pilus assembly protein TadD
MGEVYRAEDTKLKRQVALKFLPPHYSQDPEFRARFEHEAVAAAALNHPSIVTIHELAEHDGRLVIVMEYIAGKSLETRISEGDLAFADAIEIARQMCEALGKAHEAGIVHRDIKPSNVLLDADGRTKILDFGLAKSHRATTRSDTALKLGTLQYESPEQIEGGTIDHRSDLFSLGIVLYEMIAGRPPFTSEYAEAIRYAILSDTPEPLARYRADVPDSVQRLVDKLLAKSPEVRYQHASEVIADLKQATRDLRTQDGGASIRKRAAIAVLPFNNLSADPEQDYFCEGMAEDIINALAKVDGLHVAARTSTFMYKGRSLDIRTIGRKLGVTTVLEGSVRRSGSKFRIWAQLINVSDGFHLWSERYDREFEDVFVIQDEIAGSIVNTLQIILSDEERRALGRSPTSVVKAYDFYMRGRQYFHHGRRKSLVFARQLFGRAVSEDPRFALAHAAISFCCSLLVHWYGDSPDANVEQADGASLRALELDPGRAEAHAARGFALWLMNRHDESFAAFEKAAAIDPTLFEARYFYARECFQLGQLERAAELFEQACRVRDDYEARYFAAQTYSALSRPEEAQRSYRRAVAALDKRIELNPDDARALTMGAVAWCRLGEHARGLELAERALAIDPEDAGIRYNVACLYALEGEKDKAITCLEAAVNSGFAHRDWVDHDPDLDSLRDDPRFLALRWRQS